MNWIKDTLLFIFSITISLVLAEVTLKYFNFNSLGNFYPRFQNSYYKSHEEGIFAASNDLPVVLKKNYDTNFADLQSSPILKNITLDKYGHRNQNDVANIINFDTVFVGDSVVFGQGAGNKDTFVYKYEKKTAEKVYNLSIPNTGPATYMYLIDNFLRTHTTKKINLMFYSANDYINLNQASWKNMDNNQIPTSKITRKDIITKKIVYPNFMFHPLLKNSTLSLLIFNFFSNKNDEVEFSKQDFLNITDMTISYLKNASNYNLGTKKVDIYLSELSNIKEITKNAELSNTLNKIKTKYFKNDREGLFDLTKYFIIQLERFNITPISKTYRINLAVYLNMELGFRSANKVEDGYNGIINSMLNLINGLKLKKYHKEVVVSKALLLNYKKIRKENIQLLKESLINISNYYPSEVSPNIDLKNKLDIFIKYLKDLNNSGIDVTIYNYTAEYLLKPYYDNLRIEHNKICRLASSQNIKCINLIPKLVNYYNDELNSLNALYLDGSHFNKSGHDFILKEIIDF